MKIIRYDVVDSVFDEAHRICRDLGEGEYLLTANEQTSGHGQHGRTFFSPRGNGVYATLLICGSSCPDIGFAAAVTPVAAVSLTEAVRECSDYGAELGVKWINDLLLDGKKYGGILTACETSEGKIVSLRIGFGINVGNAYLPRSICGDAASLDPARVGVSSSELALACAEKLSCSLRDRLGDERYALALDGYRKLCTTVGKKVYLHGEYIGTAEEISDNFALRVKNGETETLLRSTDNVRFE